MHEISIFTAFMFLMEPSLKSSLLENTDMLSTGAPSSLRSWGLLIESGTVEAYVWKTLFLKQSLCRETY